MANTSAIFKGAYTKLLTSLGLKLEAGQKVVYTDGAAAGSIPVSDAGGTLSLNTLIGGSVNTGATQGSVLFAGASGAISQNNSNFFWDNSNVRLGVGNAAPDSKIHVQTAPTIIGNITQAGAAQTANLSEWRNSSGTALAYVTSGGAFSINKQAGAFSAGNFAALCIGDPSGDAGGNGGLYCVARAVSSNKPFSALCGWDSGTTRKIYYGGGGWGATDAMSHEFYCNVGGYNETVNGGIATFIISSGSVSTQNNAAYVAPVANNATGYKLTNSTVGKTWEFYVKSNGSDTDAIWYYNGDRFTFNKDGYLGIGKTTSLGGMLHVQANNAAVKAEVIQGAAAQTANLTEWQNSSATPVASVCPLGCGTFTGMALGIRTVTSAPTITAADYTILCDCTSGAITATLPVVASSTGRIMVFKKIDSSVNALTIDGNDSETIDGALTKSTVVQYDVIRIQCNGSAWFQI